MKEIEARIELLQARARRAKADARIEYAGIVKDLHARREAIEERVTELATAAEEARTELRDGIDRAVDDLTDALEKATERISRETG
jgi:hypothetical protein